MRIVAWTAFLAVLGPGAAEGTEPAAVVRTYATVVHRSYEAALDDAIDLRDAIGRFLDEPDASRLVEARIAWRVARDSYGRTEAFRFYEGPIDFVDLETGREGPELRLNAWPLDEAFIDSVRGATDGGLIARLEVPITAAELGARNAVDDDAHVSTGYHAIEFLLWGQDTDAAGPGDRPARDFAGDDEIQTRRRQYLRVVTELVVDDLRFLVQEWAPDGDNYAARFLREDPRVALRKILTGLIDLAGFEMAMERLAIPLDSGDQEDEHSCFSDNTHADFIANVAGIHNVYFGTHGSYAGVGLDQLVSGIAPDVDRLIREQLASVEESTADLPRPFDQMLASGSESDARREAESLVRSLRLLADLFTVVRLEIGGLGG